MTATDTGPAANPTRTPAPAQPASFAGGRYQVKNLLGEGGKKRVYLAHDGILDRDVALAVIKTEGLDETSRARITREAQAMGRLGDHPNILQIHDLGEDQGQPYLVLPLMSGGAVEGLITDAPDHRIALEQVLDISRGVCRGLEFAHSRGIVHRDLKPGNIWLTEDATPKIGDFGLAVMLDYTRITTEGMMVGTVSYMPPEQAMGGEVSPQSDLYALGAMLYEMATGRPPFLGDDAVAIIGQHINTPPVAPTWHNSKCPRPLDALILRLLAKDPSDRPESAADVPAALEAVDLATSVEQPVVEVDDAHALDSLAGGVFVGRQQEMGELKACLDDALSGRGRLVMLVGEPGIGKTRTAQEVATYAGLRGAQVLWGRCYEEVGTPPYWPWVQAIRSYVRDRDAEQLRSEMSAGAADISDIVSDVTERLPGLATPSEKEPDQARFRLFDSITTFLKSASQQQTLVLMLDDLHWADKPSLLLLEFLARELAGARLLVIGTYRDVELNRQHPLSATLGGLNRERLFQRVLLRGLTQQDVARFIELASGLAPPAGLVQAVHTQTEGNPMFVTEVVRLLVQEGELNKERDSTRESWTVRIPDGVREVIGRRLNRLSQRCNETLTIASVIGRQFGLDQLKPIAEDMSEDRLLEVLEEALAAKVIEELPQTVGQYQFTHALVQETLTDELSTTRKVRFHARIAEALEELYGLEVEAHAAELAHHFAEAEAVTGSEKLAGYSLVAGEKALAAYAYEDALAHFERGLVARNITLSGTEAASDEYAATLLFGLGRAQAATLPAHRIYEVAPNLTRAFDYYDSVGDAERPLAIGEHPLPQWPGQRTGMMTLIQRTLALVPPDSHAAGRLLSRYGWVLGGEEGDHENAKEALTQAMSIAQQEGDLALELRTLISASWVDFQHLNWEESLAKSSRAIDLAQQLDDSRSEVTARFWAGSTLLITGDLHGSLQQGLDALASAERLRESFLLTNTFSIIAMGYHNEGNWQAAGEFGDRGLAVSPVDARLLIVRLLSNYEVGDFAEGRAFLDRLLGAMSLATPGPTLTYSYPALVIPLAARIIGDVGQFDHAEAAAEVVLSSPSATPRIAAIARTGAALMAIERRDSVAAKVHYTAIKPTRGTIPAQYICADRLLGLLSQTMGNLDQAAEHFDEALAFCRKAGRRPELAWTCCDYADTLRERDADGDRAKAIVLLDESLAISSEIGMRPLMERVLARKLELQGVASIDLKTSIENVVSAVTSDQPDLRPHAAPDGTVTILFSDIEGFTRMTERLGDQRAQQVLRGHNDIIRHQVAAHGGFEVKSLGDGFMLAFSSARRAIQCAIAIQRAFAAHNREHADETVRVRIGLHTGELVKEMDDFFGKNVILASRIADQAQGGEILVLSQLGFGNCLRKRLRLPPFFRSVDVGGWQPWDENGMWSGWKGKKETSWND